MTVTRAVRARLPLTAGEFQAYGYQDTDGAEHLALAYGDLDQELLVHVHAECITGDAFGSLRCRCNTQLQAAFAAIADAGRGVVIYLRGRRTGHDTVDYRTAAAILADLGVRSVRLFDNNSTGAALLENHGVITSPY